MSFCSPLKRVDLDLVSNIIFDCDGVIWKNGILIPGVHNTLKILASKGKKLIFLTNNSTLSRRDLFLKFLSLDLQILPSSIFNSGYMLARHLRNIYQNIISPSVYVIGASGLVDELKLFGFNVLGSTEDDEMVIDKVNLTSLTWDNDNISAVIVGNDVKINYYKISRAIYYLLKDKNCLFFCTNRDPIFPTYVENLSLPAAGVMVSAIECGSGRKASEPLGKPNHLIYDILTEELSLEGKSMMVGDSLDTDILFGRKAGIYTLLVETGIHKSRDAEILPESVMPHFISNDVNILSSLLE